MTDEIILSTLMDPSTKSLVSLSNEEKLEVVYKAVKASSQLSKNPTHSGQSGETELAIQETEPIEYEILQGTSMSSARGASGSDNLKCSS